MLCVERLVQLKCHHDSTQCFLFAEEQKEVFKVLDGSQWFFHSKKVAASLHRRACAGVFEFWVASAACTKQAS